MTTRTFSTLAALACLLVLGAAEVQGQIYTSLGAGVTQPIGDFDDLYDRGFTVRGQAGLSLILAGAHAQVGWSNFATDVDTSDTDAANVFHAGVGGRLGVGLFFVGANAAYFFGDGENGIGYIPEVGISLLSLEVVADGRIDGEKWVALRGALKF